MLRRLLLISISVAGMGIHSTAFGWGEKGHSIVCHIAEQHLTDKSMQRVTELLDGRSMVYYSGWADNVKYEGQYKYTRPWHYISIENRDKVATTKRVKEGDILSASELLVTQLSDRQLSREEHSVALKLLLHLIGDMHQPLHTGRNGDKGGATIPVVYFVESASLHSVWDHHIVEGAHPWSYTEWQVQLDRLTREEVAEVVSGGFEEWIDQTHDIVKQIYRDTPPETRIFYEYMQKYTPIVEQQLLHAGLRLAHTLNCIFEE